MDTPVEGETGDEAEAELEKLEGRWLRGWLLLYNCGLCVGISRRIHCHCVSTCLVLLTGMQVQAPAVLHMPHT